MLCYPTPHGAFYLVKKKLKNPLNRQHSRSWERLRSTLAEGTARHPRLRGRLLATGQVLSCGPTSRSSTDLQEDLNQLQAITEMSLSFYLPFHFYLCLTFSLSCIVVSLPPLCLHRYFWIKAILYSNFFRTSTPTASSPC